MLTIRLELQSIDYERSVAGLLPMVVERCAAKASPGPLEKFMARLGTDAVPVAERLLNYLGDDAKDRLIVWLLTSHEEALRGSFNGYLEQILPGGVVRVGRLGAEDREGSRLMLRASRVEVDYRGLLASPLLSAGVEHLGMKGAAALALRVGSMLPPEQLEKQGLALLGSEGVKAGLLSAMTGALEKIGLFVTPWDLYVGPDSGPEEEAGSAGTDARGLFPGQLEDALLDALAAYLKETAGSFPPAGPGQ